MDLSKFPILSKINSPDDLKKLPSSELTPLAEEIRSFLIENVTATGGHLASNLGVVELSIALHRVFSSPKDHIIWDVGHQCYTHKLLTGRTDRFDTLRAPGGLSGFTKREESEHDSFGSGHSSTSLSAALGFAFADRIENNDSYTIAVIGDGAFTGGMVSEALNNLDPSLPFLIIFNENEMSISKNVGSFARYISNIRSTKKYFTVKHKTHSLLSDLPLGQKIDNGIRKLKRKLKNNIYGSNYFENIGLTYLGPIDGNNTEKVISLLEEAKRRKKSAVIHLKTLKGKGYSPAETAPELFHSVYPDMPTKNSFSHAFGTELISIAQSNKDVCAITAAMSHGCGLSEFEKLFPDRFFDVGIAEAHAATFAAGLAAAGKHPVFAVYSSFLQRSYDNLIHDIALQRLPVTVAIDRACLAGADGPTHHGIFDVAFLSSIPNIELYTPSSFESLKKALRTSVETNSPTFIRYPSGAENTDAISRMTYSGSTLTASFENAEKLDAVIITYGKVLGEAVKASDALASENISCGVISLEKLIPYENVSREILSLLPNKKIPVLFVEEGMKNGGAAMNIYECVRADEKMTDRKFKIRAITDFAPSVKNRSIYEACGLDSNSLIYIIKEEF